MYNIVSLSGGKDSTYMLHEMIRRGVHIDEVVNCDTTIEFPEMHEHLEFVKKNIAPLTITTLRPEKDFEYYMFEHVMTRSKRAGQKGYGWPNPNYVWCRGQLKLDVINRYLKDKYGDNYVSNIGIAFDEYGRYDFEFAKGHKRYPLIEWKITELESIRGCHELGYTWGGLYDRFYRVSCWCCPLQSIKELYMLYSFYPHLWQKLREYDSRQNARFRKDYTLQELQERFDGLLACRYSMLELSKVSSEEIK